MSSAPRTARRAAAHGAILLLLAATSADGQDLPRANDRWATTGRAELIVIGQASPRRVEEIARDLALVRSGLLSIAGAPDHRAPYPTTVVVLSDDKTLLSYSRAADAPGGAAAQAAILTALDRQGRVLALSLESVEAQLPRAREILAGDLLDQLLIAPPPWLRNGLAGLMARMEAAGRAGDPPRLIERASSATGAAPADAAVGLMRHLANPRSERSSQLRRYLTLLRGGAPADAAFEESFFGSFDAISAEVAQVSARGGAAPIELAPAPATLEPARDLAYDRAVLALGDLLLRAVPWNTVAAEMHLRAVLERHPGDAVVLRDIAIARELDGRHQDAATLWEQSLAAAPDDRVTLMLAGWSRLEHFRRSVQARRGWEEPLPAEVVAARDLFTRAVAPPPGEAPSPPAAPAHHADHGGHRHDVTPPIAADASPHALHGFGATYLFATDRFDPGIAALDRAARLLPADDEIAADLILLHAHAGNQNLSWEMRRERLLGRVAPELEAMVEKLLVEEALHAAKELLLVEQKPESAIALVRGAAAEVRDPGTRQEIERVLAQMEQVAATLVSEAIYERFNADYEKARRLLAERRFVEARRLIEPYAAATMDPLVRQEANKVLGMIDQVDR